MTTAKIKITALVQDYARLFPDEFKNFKTGIKQKKNNLKDKYATTKSDGIIERSLFEIPETLDYLFMTKLSKEEIDWFYTKEGSHWFVKNFKDFRITYEV